LPFLSSISIAHAKRLLPAQLVSDEYAPGRGYRR